MMFKALLLIACVMAAQAGLIPELKEKTEETYESHPSYSFSYDVQDAITGDFKSQSETRDGDNVQGQYMLHDADGYRRIVEYSSDAINGFQANVRREPLDAAYLKPAPALQQIKTETHQAQLKAVVPSAAVLRTYAAPAIVHAAAAPTLVHSAPSVHLTPAILKTGQAVYAHQPASVVKTTYPGAHVSFVY